MKHRVACVDDRVTRGQMRGQGGNRLIHRIARLHHQDDRAGAGHSSSHRGKVGMAGQSGRQRPRFGDKGRGLVRRPVGHMQCEPMVQNVQRQGRAHGAKAIQAESCEGHGGRSFLWHKVAHRTLKRRVPDTSREMDRLGGCGRRVLAPRPLLCRSRPDSLN